MRISDYEKAIGRKLNAPKKKTARAECACYLSCDIGAYNTCRHLCRYCYANAEPAKVMTISRQHDPTSPFLIGNDMEGDQIHDVIQESWIDAQESLWSFPYRVNPPESSIQKDAATGSNGNR